MPPTLIRRLQPGDEPALERYLASRPDSTLFLRSNLRATGGLGGDPEQTFGGVYVGALQGDRVVGVASHVWNGNVILECDHEPGALVRQAARDRGGPLHGLIGPTAQVNAARTNLGLMQAETSMDSSEILYSLDLDALRMPAALATQQVRFREATDRDAPLLYAWRIAYFIEALGYAAGPACDAEARASVDRGLRSEGVFVLEDAGEVVAMSGFNARIPSCVQIGAVYTPPALRGRGYGRAVVAGSLNAVADQGVVRSLLFTDEENVPARRAYEGLGFAAVGTYALCFFSAPQQIA